MIFTKDPAPLKVTVRLAQVTTTGLLVVDSAEYVVPKDWGDVTAAFTVTQPGQYKPVFFYRGWEWLGRAANVTTAPKVLKWKTSMRSI
jgi:hypothetical protein